MLSTSQKIAIFLYKANLFAFLLILISPISFWIIISLVEKKGFSWESLAWIGIFYIVAIFPSLIGCGLLWGYHRIANGEKFAVENKLFWIISGIINTLWTIFILGSGFLDRTGIDTYLNPIFLIALWSIGVALCSFYTASLENKE